MNGPTPHPRRGTPAGTERIPALLAILAVAAWLGLSLRVAPYQVDDAWITYRYAAHVAAGDGPTFNVGGPAVEGFTSPAWMLALAGVAAASSPGVLPVAAMILGILATAGVLALAGRAARDGGAWAEAAAVLLVALSPTTVYYAVTGMEEPLFVAVVLAATASLGGALPAWAGIAAGATAMAVRPEGGWIPVALAAQALAMRAGTRRGAGAPGPGTGRRWLVLAVAVAAGGLVVVAVRWAVFGDVVPNTFHAKEPDLAGGLRYAWGLLKAPWGALLAAAAVAGAAAGGPLFRGFLAAGAAWVAAAVLEGGDWMPAWRLLMPATACLGLAAAGVAVPFREPPAGDRPARPRDAIVRWLLLAALALGLAAGTSGAWTAWTRGDAARRSHDELRAEARGVAEFLRRSGARSIALIDIGETGFRSPAVEVVDLAGLTDRTIAAAPGGLMAKRFDRSYLFDERRPDLLLVRLSRLPPRDGEGRLAPFPEDAMSEVERDVLADPRRRALYHPLFLQVPAVPRDPLYGRMVFVRNGVDLDPAALPPSDLVAVKAEAR